MSLHHFSFTVNIQMMISSIDNQCFLSIPSILTLNGKKKKKNYYLEMYQIHNHNCKSSTIPILKSLSPPLSLFLSLYLALLLALLPSLSLHFQLNLSFHPSISLFPPVSTQSCFDPSPSGSMCGWDLICFIFLLRNKCEILKSSFDMEF